VPLAEAAFADALKEAGLTVGEVDHLVVTGLHSRAVRVAATRAGVEPGVLVDDRAATIGVTGTAHPGIVLADALERAEPGAVIALLVLADGADCMVFRTSDEPRRAAPTVADQLDGRAVSYEQARLWRNSVRREPPRRPDPDRPAGPPAMRNAAWKFGFIGSTCTECGTRHLPPQRVCLECHAVDRMQPERLAGVRGTLATVTVDHLAFSAAPPVVVGVVDLDGGGRLQCELTDADPSEVGIGDRVELSFRRLYATADGVHNYFWKARPVRGEEG
jgi:hydroxymethylglutaryl-CoA synthase